MCSFGYTAVEAQSPFRHRPGLSLSLALSQLPGLRETAQRCAKNYAATFCDGPDTVKKIGSGGGQVKAVPQQVLQDNADYIYMAF